MTAVLRPVLLDAAGEHTLDLDRLIETRLILQATSGYGKSWALRRLLEQSYGRVQQLVIDPEGEFASLREKYDYVYAAPTGGDTVAHPRSAALLAEKLLELRASAILDIYELSSVDRILFVQRFLDAMLNAPKALWHQVMVAVDEAHVFCPEKGSGEAQSSEAVKGLSTRGRKRGFCPIYATQRISSFSKDAAATCMNKLIGACGLDTDVKRASVELGFVTPEDRRQLRTLKPGDFFAFGPAIATEVTRVRIGPVATKHPKLGVAYAPPAPRATVARLLERLADLPKEAEERHKSETDLRKEVAELKRQLSAVRKTQAPAERIEVPVLKAGELKALERLLDRLGPMAIGLQGFADSIAASAKHIQVAVRAAQTPAAAPARTAPAPRERALATDDQAGSEGRRGHGAPTGNGTGSLTKGHVAILVAIAQDERGVTRDQLGVLTGYKRSTRNEYLALLLREALVQEANGLLMATEAGIDALGTRFEPLPKGAALLVWWQGRLPLGEKRLLEAVIGGAAGPVARSREELDERTGFKRSTRNEYLGHLAARRLVEFPKAGLVQASALLFD